MFPIVDENDETRQATIAREMSDDSTIEMQIHLKFTVRQCRHRLSDAKFSEPQQMIAIPSEQIS